LDLHQTAVFGKSLLAHECGKLLKGQQGLLEPFDGHLLEDVLLMGHHKDLPGCIDAQVDVLSDPIHMDVVASFTYAHRAVRSHLPNEMLSMHLG
jgi:hypothetical protein